MSAGQGGCSQADWLQCWKREIFDQNSRVNEDIYTLVTRAITNTHLSFSVYKLPWSQEEGAEAGTGRDPGNPMI